MAGEPEDWGSPCAYQVLQRGTRVYSTDDVHVGNVRKVLSVPEKDVFDGLQIDTPDGQRFVDGPEVERIYERRVQLSIDSAAVARLPRHDGAGGPSYAADPAVGKLGALFKRGWRRR
jgi:hypothetical protein